MENDLGKEIDSDENECFEIIKRKCGNKKCKCVDTTKLFVAISDLHDKYNIKLKSFPQIVVIGPQSAGKSSVIESICGETLFPKGMKMATKKPMHLTTINSPKKKFMVGNREFKSDIEAANEIARMNNNNHLQKIFLTIWSPDVYNSYLVDLPGLFVVASKDEIGLPKKIKDLTCHYLQDPNNIPVIVHSGPSDPATNHAIKLINKFNREVDALGIITKMDMLEKQKTEFIQDMLRGQTYKIGHGYCAVVLRNDNDIEMGKTINDKIKEESEYFDKIQLQPSGVNQMRKMISDIQYHKIKEQIPNLVMDIDNEISNLNASRNLIFNLLTDDHSTMPSKLRIMIEKLVGSSLDRAEFESNLRLEFKKIIWEYIKESIDPGNKVKSLSTNDIDPNILNYNSLRMSNPIKYKDDNIKELFLYGLLSPVFIDNQTIQETVGNEILLGTTLPMIEFYVDDPLGKKRSKWNKYLSNYFSRLLTDDNIFIIVHDVTERLLLEYICQNSESADDLSKKFAEYMIKEIGNEIYESKIKYTIKSILNIEKRPQVSIFELTRYISQMYPEYFTYQSRFMDLWRRDIKKLRIEVYGDEWNEAYLKVIGDKLAENCYRNVAVNLLDGMVEKLLEMAFDMFNKENAEREQHKIEEKIKKLEDIRSIITSYNTD